VHQKGSKVDQEGQNYSRVYSRSASKSGQYAESDEGDRLGRNSSGLRIPECISRRIAIKPVLRWPHSRHCMDDNVGHCCSGVRLEKVRYLD
jgi:hypothetical protein